MESRRAPLDHLGPVGSSLRSARRGTRTLIVVAILFVTALGPTMLRAKWKDATDVIHHTAYTIDKGAITIGLWTPLMYGLDDRVTLVTHPLLQLILTPNVGLRINLVSRPFALSLTGTYLQSIVDTGDNGTSPGYAQFGLIASVPFGPHIVATAAFRYGFTIGPFVESLRPSLSLNAVFDSSNALVVQLHLLYYLDEGAWDTFPRINAFYAHAWGDVHLGVGLAVGRFIVDFREIIDAFGLWPVYPIIDVWWKF